jgi:hypothetical protein
MKAKEVNKIADSMNIEDECDVCGEISEECECEEFDY